MGNQPSPLSRNKIKRYIKVVNKYKKPIVILDVGARFVDLNSYALKMFKLKTKKIFYTTALKDLCPETQPHINVESIPFLTDWFHTTLNSTSGQGNVVFNYLLPDKSDRWSLITLTKVEFSDITLAQLVFVGIKNPKLNKIQNIPEPLSDVPQSDYQSDSGVGKTTSLSQEESVPSETEYNLFSDESVHEVHLLLNDIQTILSESIEEEQVLKKIKSILQRLEILHSEAIKEKEKRKATLEIRINKERKDNNQKINKIEVDLKRRIDGQEKERKLKEKLVSENEKLKNLSTKIKDYYNENQSLLLNSLEENQQLLELFEDINQKMQNL
ncbi:hypothetical protein M0813_12899 [Anaeramoeba flamelloides]|uniref:PAS domain-containing protein n=1 Tax=Anaeramoeba flamelloides TaxID=1746091 RepID=A0ABQ8ZAU0_9EUKA|nr:hypothetical protein M0813_12899 [Anaeramoeba flamelloides]